MDAHLDELVPRGLLSEDEGLTNQQIAEALGLTLDTVKIRLRRARAASGLDSGAAAMSIETRTTGWPASRRRAYPRGADLRLQGRRREVTP